MTTRTRIFVLLSVCFVLLLACNFRRASAPAPVLIPAEPAPTRQSAPPPATKMPTVVPEMLPTVAPETSYGSLAREHLEVLSEEIGSRLPGSPEEAEAAAYVEAAFEAYGYEVAVQPFSFVTENEEELESVNVIAVKPGVSTEELIVGAHYDSSDEAEGADDNASGVAVLLEVAELLQDVETPYNVRLIAFGAEEADLDGSRYYAGRMDDAEIQNTVGMINLDSLAAGDVAYVYGDPGPGTLRDWIMERAEEAGFDLEARAAEDMDEPDGTPCECADYGPFQEAGIQFAYFEATNWDLGEQGGMTQVDLDLGEEGVIRHTEYDTLEYIDTTFPERIDDHFDLFVTLLYDTLTQFEAQD
ncbi:MAG: M20/M25/M40 family metallo-hydrolase [Anaerolineae bacterium]|nr:M20/M25/M40 family metallo-hydrolase [Anaerolineae bacterium]